ncbi:uncharacterized protein C2orf80 homolog [Pelecanus crispus]|uniref:uncharacterized protein C2orf80 homolog n=1 Tax=Pelecanus crispus TaxID=36300 RepID=UPI003F5D0383
MALTALTAPPPPPARQRPLSARGERGGRAPPHLRGGRQPRRPAGRRAAAPRPGRRRRQVGRSSSARRETFECNRDGGQPAPRPAPRGGGGGSGRFPLPAAPPAQAGARPGVHKLSVPAAGCGGVGTLLPPSLRARAGLREIGIRLRENELDSRGQKQSTFRDDMVHYNLAFSVALLWLSDLDTQTALTREKMIFAACNQSMYPNRIEREAMILSSYAGILMNSIPIEEIFEIYSMRPSATAWQSSANDHRSQPFKLSLHPFAMLTAPEAAEYTWKQSIKYRRAAAYQKTSPCSARRAKKDGKQWDSLTRGKQQVDQGATEAKQGISPEKPGTDSKARNAKEAKT